MGAESLMILSPCEKDMCCSSKKEGSGEGGASLQGDLVILNVTILQMTWRPLWWLQKLEGDFELKY